MVLCVASCSTLVHDEAVYGTCSVVYSSEHAVSLGGLVV